MRRNVKALKQRRQLWRTVAVVLLGFGFVGVLSWYEGRRALKAESESRSVPPYKCPAMAGTIPPLVPANHFRDNPLAQRAYRIAAEIPTIVAQQPCYCHCEKLRHESLLDCFTSDHAANCLICIEEVLLVHRMNKRGSKVEEIRNAIIHGKWRDVDVSMVSK